MTRISNPLNYSRISPKQTEARKLRITAKTLHKYSMRRAIDRYRSYPEDAHNLHITMRALKFWQWWVRRQRGGLLLWFPPHSRKQLLRVEILNSDSRVPDFLCDTSYWLPRVSLPVHINVTISFPLSLRGARIKNVLKTPTPSLLFLLN